VKVKIGSFFSTDVSEGLLPRLPQRIANITVASLISTLFIVGAGVGIGVVSAPVASAVPLQPVITGTSSLSTQIVVTFTDATTETLQGYKYTTNADAASPTWASCVPSGSDCEWVSGSKTVTIKKLSTENNALRAGSSYQIQIRGCTTKSGQSLNDASCGPISVTQQATAGVPDAPTIGTATAGNGQVTVSWTAPSNNGGATIESYTATSSPGGFTCTYVGSGSNSCDVTGLSNGTSYAFIVKAYNSSGSSPASGSVSATPRTVPNAPTIGTATAGNGQVTVSWTAPSNNGGATIDSYTVTTVEDTSKTCTYTGSGSSSCTVTGLTNGTAYTFTAKAYNVAGASIASSASSPATPTSGVTVPGAPTIGTATAYNETATVTWSFSGSNGGAAIESFTATSNPGSLKCYGIGASATSCEVSGLTNGTAYTFTVKANNSVGSSSASSASSPAVTPAGPPTEPDTLTATAATLSLDISWRAPNSTNGSALVGYYIEISSNSGSSWTQVNPSSETSTATTATISGLSGDSTYLFRVSAINGKGRGNAKAIGSGVKPNKNSQTISWSTFSQSMTYNETQTVSISSSGSGSATFSVTGQCAVTAANQIYATGVGDCVVTTLSSATSSYGEASDTKTITIAAGNPDDPSVSTPTSGNGTISVSATAAKNAGGVTLSHFKYEYKTSSGGSWTTYSETTTVSAEGSASKTLTGFTNGVSYDVRVSAVNASGKSSNSVVKSSITPSTTPGPPSNPTVVTYTESATVSWSAPTDNGGASIDSYTVMMKTNSGSYQVVVSGLNSDSYTVNGLSSSNEYQFYVYASNLRGKGTDSSATGAVRPGLSNQTVSLSAAARINFNEETTTTYSTDAGAAGGSLTLTSESAEYCSITTDNKVRAIKSGPCVIKVSASGSATHNANSKTLSITIDPIEPDAPETSTVTTTTSSILVNWNALASTRDGGNGGSGIKGYKLEYSANDGSTWTTVVDTFTATSESITALSANTEYLVRLKSINNSNKYSSATPFKVKTNAASKAARSLAATADSSTVNFGQTVSLTKGGSSTGSRWVSTDTSVCTVDDTGTVTSVGAGTCTINLVAEEDGTYVAETATATITIDAVNPSAPVLSDPVVGEEQITLSWAAPTSKGGAASITGYTVTSTPTGFGCTTTGATTCTITGLDSSVTYTFTITATSNRSKTSSASSAKTAKPNAKAATTTTPAPAPRIDPTPTTPAAPKEPAKAAPKPTDVLPPVQVAPATTPVVPTNGNIVTLKNGKEEVASLVITQQAPATTNAAAPVVATKAEIKGPDWSMAVVTTVAPAAAPSAGGGSSEPAASQISFEKGASAQTTGAGFAPRTYISVYLFSDPILIGKIRTDGFGNFKGSIKIPADMEVGNHTLQLNGLTKGLEVRTASLPVVVIAKQAATAKPTPAPVTTQAPVAPAKKSAVSFSVSFGLNSWWVNSSGYNAMRAAIKKVPAGAKNIAITVTGNKQETNVDPYPNIGLDRAKAVVKAMRFLGFGGRYTAVQNDEAGMTTAEYRRADVTISWTAP
jgi:hypothetical protein